MQCTKLCTLFSSNLIYLWTFVFFILQMDDGTSIRSNDVISIAEMFEDRRYSMHNIPYRYRVCKFFCVFVYIHVTFKNFFYNLYF